MHYRSSRQAGFTLVELLFVITISIVITVGAAGLFFQTLIGNSRKSVVSTVKDEGDFAIGQMEFLLRNALVLQPDPANPNGAACAAGMTGITFKSLDDGVTTLLNVGGRIASRSAVTRYLTSSAVTLTGPTFDCVQSASGNGYIKISFSLSKNTTDYATSTPITENFVTSVNLRSMY